MRDLREINSELLLVTEIRAALREDGGDPSLVRVDPLLDERLSALPRRRGGNA
jgi:Fe-S cluster biogenesis protein NfuA